MRTQALLAIALCACTHSISSSATNDGGGDDDSIDAAVPSDAASSPSDAGSAGCGLAYCEDFDAYGSATLADATTLGPWAVAVSAVTMTIDSVHAYGGSGKSLHIKIPAFVNSHTGGTPTHGLLSQKASAGLVAGNDLYGRVMLYYSNTDGNELPLSVHSWFFEAAGTSTKLAAATSLNLGGGGAKLQLNYAPGDVSVQGGTMTTGAWHCVQWQYDGAGATPANVAKVWIDGKVALNIPVGEGWNFATPWSSFSFGFTHYQTLSNTVEIFLDDFALDGAMIACP